MSSIPTPCDVDKWTRAKCVHFLRTVKDAKLSGNKSELVTRVKGFFEHPRNFRKYSGSPKINSYNSIRHRQYR